MVCPRAPCPPELTGPQHCNLGVFPGRSPGQRTALHTLGLLLLQACPRPWDVGPSHCWQHQLCRMAPKECGSSLVVPHAGAAPMPY